VPAAVVGLTASFLLVPESRASVRPRLDSVGVALSVSGLVGVTYGLIETGRHGWSSAGAVLPILAGLALLLVFCWWERRLSLRADGWPLVDPVLFRSASFTWGVILLAVDVLAMIGALFAMPQYFQGVLGTDAMGSGLRLLPLIAGLIAGAVPADQIARRLGAKLTVAAGFVLLAAGLMIGARTGVTSSNGFVAAWMALVGAGMGLSMATASSAALSELSEEHAGIGSAVLQTVNKTGGPLGTAILGSVLSSAYLSHLSLAGLPATAATAVRQSVFGGVAIAHQAHSAALLENVRTAFTDGLDNALLVSGGVAVAGALLALLFLPRATPLPTGAPTPARRGADLVNAS